MMDLNKKNQHLEKKQEIFVEPNKAVGAYSNLVLVRHTSEEFQLDFIQRDPGGISQLVTRIWLSPPHMKRLVKALSDNLERYQETFGEIVEPKPKDAKQLKSSPQKQKGKKNV